MDETTELLHLLRLRGRIDVARATDSGNGTSPKRDGVDGEHDARVPPRAVAALVDAGYATRRHETLVLTPAGRVEADARGRLPESSDAIARTRMAFRRFLPLNEQLLRICHDWQMRPGDVINDHRDARYDASVVDRLVALHEQAGPLTRRLGERVPRFAGYRPRLQAALERVRHGEGEYLAGVKVDSYHTIWMQLHEDLLVALGLERGGDHSDV